jgi:RNA polymerase sigma-70 factor (ECF subfamily)
MESTYGTSSSLLDRVQSDQAGAWEQFCQIYMPLVYGWSRRAGLQDADAQDVSQDTFQTVAKKIKSFRYARPDDSFRGWLWVIHRSRLVDWFRIRGDTEVAEGGSAARGKLARVPDWLTQDGVEPEPDPNEEAALVQRALRIIEGDFSQSTWQAFWLFTVEGFSADEVAKKLKTTPAAVRQAKFRVMTRLKEVLE